MKTLNLVQGSPEWHQHRATSFNASDAPAMLGVSPYKTRSELLREKATGITPDVDQSTQRRFDDGHRYEALARPLAEQIIGEELFPCVGSEGKLSASFDGLTMAGDAVFEHKTPNDEIRAAAQQGNNAILLPDHYRAQMEQQLMVSGADRVLFLATKWDGDTLVEQLLFWHFSDPELRDRIVHGWCQFAEDLAAYQERPQEAPAPAGKAPDQLPALHIAVTGMVTASNLAEYKGQAIAFFKGIKTDLQTDQDFADAEKAVKFCSDIESRVEAAKQHALSQTATIDELFRALDSVKEEARSKRLELDKLVKSRKESIRSEIAYAGRDAIAAHYDTMNATLGEHHITLPATIGADLNAAIKGKRTVSSIRDAVDGVVAQHKIAASQKADQVRACIAVLADAGAGHETLFADRVVLCASKAPDDLRNLIKARIAEHDAKERQRIENEREKIRAEEAAKLKAEQESKAAQEAREMAPAPAAPVATPVASPASVAAPVNRTPAPKSSRPTDRQIIDVLTLHYRVHDSVVIGWLLDMDIDAASNELAT